MVTDALGNVATRVNSASGVVVTQTSRRGGVTAYVYDSRDRPTSITDAVGNRATFGYDEVGKPDVGGRWPGHHLDGLVRHLRSPPSSRAARPRGRSRIATTTRAMSISSPTRTGTSRRRRIATTIVTSSVRSSLPMGPTVSRTYDARGSVLTETNELAQIVTYAYDANGRATSVEFAGERTTLDYDENGNLRFATPPRVPARWCPCRAGAGQPLRRLRSGAAGGRAQRTDDALRIRSLWQPPADLRSRGAPDRVPIRRAASPHAHDSAQTRARRRQSGHADELRPGRQPHRRARSSRPGIHQRIRSDRPPGGCVLPHPLPHRDRCARARALGVRRQQQHRACRGDQAAARCVDVDGRAGQHVGRLRPARGSGGARRRHRLRLRRQRQPHPGEHVGGHDDLRV